jgi:hypothetical protein
MTVGRRPERIRLPAPSEIRRVQHAEVQMCHGSRSAIVLGVVARVPGIPADLRAPRLLAATGGRLDASGCRLAVQMLVKHGPVLIAVPVDVPGHTPAAQAHECLCERGIRVVLLAHPGFEALRDPTYGPGMGRGYQFKIKQSLGYQISYEREEPHHAVYQGVMLWGQLLSQIAGQLVEKPPSILVRGVSVDRFAQIDQCGQIPGAACFAHLAERVTRCTDDHRGLGRRSYCRDRGP